MGTLTTQKGKMIDTNLKDLGTDQAIAIQHGLNQLGYFCGKVDGIVGPKTLGAWNRFKISHYLSSASADIVGNGSMGIFTKELKRLETKEGVIESIRNGCDSVGLTLNTQQAYVLATVHHETNATFKPVREAYWLSEDWRKRNLRYYPYYGRGYVQITWDTNYEKYSDILGIDCLNDPDLMLNHEYALFVLVHGFANGIFTGQKLTEFVSQSKCDFINARRCINGLNRAKDIADLARTLYL
jgi:predicted chitinase